jgi:alpha-galactosidase
MERILDLAKPEVKAYVESQIIRLIERYQLDMFRLDYNVSAIEGGFNIKDGVYENSLWRHVEAIYDIFERIGKRYPLLQLENCASGGGRTDIGMVSKFTTTWISDWFNMPRTVRILNGMSLALPPEYLNRTFAVIEGSNADTQMHVAIMAHPTIIGVAHTLAEANPILMEIVRKYIRIYKEFIRPFHRTTKVYHHNPVIPGGDGAGWCAIEYVSKDQKKAIACVFRLVNADDEMYSLKFRGLNPNCEYEVQVQPGGEVFASMGYKLCREGMEIRLDTALTSRLFLLTAK